MKHIYMKKLFKAGENIREKVFSTHKGPGIVSVFTSQTGKPHNSWGNWVE